MCLANLTSRSRYLLHMCNQLLPHGKHCISPNRSSLGSAPYREINSKNIIRARFCTLISSFSSFARPPSNLTNPSARLASSCSVISTQNEALLGVKNMTFPPQFVRSGFLRSPQLARWIDSGKT